MRLSIRAKLISSAGLILIAMGIVGWQGAVGMRDINTQLNKINSDQFDPVLLATNANIGLIAWNRAMLNHVLAENIKKMDEYEKIMLEQKTAVLELLQILSGLGGLSVREKELILEVLNHFSQSDPIQNRVVALSRGGQQGESRSLIRKELRPIVDHMDINLTEFLRLQDRQLDETMKATDERYTHALLRIFFVIGISIFVSLLIFIFLSTAIIKNVNGLVRGAKLVAAQDFTQAKVRITSKDEFGYLAGIFNGMVNSLSENLSERKRIEEALRKTKEDLDKAQKIAHIGNWSRDLNLNHAQWSDEMYRILGLTPGDPTEPSFETFLSRVHPEDRERITSILKEAAEKKKVFDFEFRTISIEGSERIVRNRGEVEYDETGAPVRFFGTDQDITERKQAEEELRKSEERLQSIIDNTMAVIYLKDTRGKHILTNSQYEALFHITNDQIIGKTDYDIFPREAADAMRENDQKVIDAGVAIEFEEIVPHDDGPHTYISLKFPLRDPSGVLYGVCSISTDITQYKKIDGQLHQARKMQSMGTLAGGIAHDFNNILTTIIGNARLALMDISEDGPLREEIEEIKIAGERAASLTRQLLAFSRKQTVQPEILDFNELLTDIEKMLARLIGEDIELSMIQGPELWQVEADLGQMEQVVMNLAVNAKDAMPKGGKLTVETANVDLDGNHFRKHGIKEELPGNYMMLAVSDTGIGIDKETQEYIFEPFFTTKGVGKGTGLGLSTVYGIVKQNNGFIWVYSEPGQGTTFKVYLPKAKGDMASEKKEQHPVTELGGSETVLIVEDDDSVRKLARTVLKQRGYKVLEAQNGEDALRVSEAHDGSIDLLIT
ncbi:MAG: PAS domain-containing protein, partial [Desulfobacteraceae bacterium]|nr:PAS domain-containing protein [Desulfobacteraceae bacterium]